MSRTHTARDNLGWLEHTVSGIASSIERAIFTEEHSRKPGWLQGLDPRAKLAIFAFLVLVASFSHSAIALVLLYAAILVAAFRSEVPFDFFVRRVWLGIPLFAGVVVLPAIFMTPGTRIFDVAFGPLHLAPSVEGVLSAIVFILRVGVSVSLAVLLVLTTGWADVLKSLQALRVPQVFILLLSMTYRYIFLFLHSANGMLEARKSRIVRRASAAQHRRWIVTAMMTQLNRSFKLSNDVYAAMLARGFTGSIRTHNIYRFRSADSVAMLLAVGVGVATLLVGRIIG